MSYQYHGTTNLITLPEREVQTFPSGLVRITRTYVCRKGLEGQFRQLLAEGSVLPNDDAAPCIDGAYIFPTPIENIRDDGFVEFRVTAYGRANVTGQQRQNIQPTVIEGDTFTYADLIVENVLPSATALQNLNVAPNLSIQIVAESTNGDELVRTIPIPAGAIVRKNQLIGFAWLAIYGGVIFERRSEFYQQFRGWNTYQRAYMFNTSNKQLKASEQRYFGFFSEFSSVYGIAGAPAVFIGDWENFTINGVVV